MSQLTRVGGLLLVTILLPLGQNCAGSEHGLPNVLLLIVDDLRPVMGCYGGPAITPNLDRFARSATTFTHHCVQWPVCGPSRASLMGGLRPDSSGVYENGSALRIASRPETRPTMPLWFRNHGYTTLSFGKTYHGKGSGPGFGWSEPAWHPKTGWTCYVDFPIAKDNKWDWRPAYEIYDGPDRLHNDYQTATQSIKALEEHPDTPIFIAAGFYKPHLPFVAPRRYWDRYEDVDTSVENSGFPEGAADYMYRWSEIWSYGMDEEVPFSERRPPTPQQGSDMVRAYLAAVSFIDAQIGRILDKLDQLGMRDSTAVVIWGDHGFHLGDHRRWAKHTQFENAMRSPLLVRLPGQQRPGVVSAALVETIDVYPSLCEYCSLDAPGHLEGLSFLPVVRGETTEGKPAAYSQIHPVGKSERHLMAYSVRTPNFRYVQWRDTQNQNRMIWRELYDHRKDPDETKSVAEEPEYEPVLREHARLMRKGYPSLKE